MKLHIEFTCEASPLPTEARLRALILKKFKEFSHFIDAKFDGLDVTEGAEKCGSGKLHITGSGSARFAFAAGYDFTLDSTGSRWRNYGAPSGTKYDIVLDVVMTIQPIPVAAV